MIVEADGVRAPQAVKLLGNTCEVSEQPLAGVGGRVTLTVEAEVTGIYMQGGQRVTAVRALAIPGVQ